MNKMIQSELEQSDRESEAFRIEREKKDNWKEIIHYSWKSGLVLDVVINLIFPYPGWDYIFV
jgi:hypothetical protein